MKNTLIYKFSKSLFPCLLITLSIGFTYAFSLFVPHIAKHINVTENCVRFAFCLNIFWLGIGAALFGKLIEHKIKTAAILSTVLLFLGLCLSGVGMIIGNIWFLFIGFGFIAGISEGIGYVTPVLNNILWFGKGKYKGFVASLSIISFGLGSTLCSVLFGYLLPLCGIKYIFFTYAGIYLVMMTIGSYMIGKPRFVKSKSYKSGVSFSYANLIKDRYAQLSWLYMFLNISMGLVLIGSCASILSEINISKEAIIVIMVLCGVFNGGGRLVFPLLTDMLLKNRLNMLVFVLILEISIMFVPVLAFSLIPLSIIVINSTYGCFFSMLPSVLSDHYGNKNLSIIHSAVLSSWGFASLFAFACTYMMSAFSSGYGFLPYILMTIYALNLLVVLKLKKI